MEINNNQAIIGQLKDPVAIVQNAIDLPSSQALQTILLDLERFSKGMNGTGYVRGTYWDEKRGCYRILAIEMISDSTDFTVIAGVFPEYGEGFIDYDNSTFHATLVDTGYNGVPASVDSISYYPIPSQYLMPRTIERKTLETSVQAIIDSISGRIESAASAFYRMEFGANPMMLPIDAKSKEYTTPRRSYMHGKGHRQ